MNNMQCLCILYGNISLQQRTTDNGDPSVSRITTSMPVFIGVLRHASKFIERFIENGGDPTMDFVTLLQGLDIATFEYSPDDIANLLLANTTETFTKFLTRIGIDNALTICDELCATSAIDRIILQNTLLDKQSPPIINNTIYGSENIFRAYERGYSIIPYDPMAFDMIHYRQTSISLPSPSQNSASDNGLYHDKIEIFEKNENIAMSETNLKEIRHVSLHVNNTNMLHACSNLTSIDVDIYNTIDAQIEQNILNALDKFAHNISSVSGIVNIERFKKVLTAKSGHFGCIPSPTKTRRSSQYYIGDAEIGEFANLKKLIMGRCRCKYITLCPTYASTLKTLICNIYINDDDLRSYHMLKEINVENNLNIKTCAPFAKTLKILNASGQWCALTDNGINMCKKLKRLNASKNNNITTCDPFAKTLICLDASGVCGITNNGLWQCTKLQKLNASNNRNIETRISFASFAHTIKKLNASHACGISDDGLSHCSKLEYLNASYNRKITTCDPFAKTLIWLCAMESCGITDSGLRLCNKLKILYAYNNHLITTCDPFSQSLEILDASGWICGIGDNGLRMCTKLKKLDASSNEKITTCKPFTQSLEILRIHARSGIREQELRLCSNIKILFAERNENIASHRYLFDVRYDTIENPLITSHFPPMQF